VKTYFVYIMAGASRALHTGVTNNLRRRVFHRQSKLVPGSKERYNINRLVYYEVYGGILAAIAREKQIKSWGRKKKVALIKWMNPDWKDLSAGWYGGQGGGPSRGKNQSEIPRRPPSRTADSSE
jgi:putative endonuclease